MTPEILLIEDDNVLNALLVRELSKMGYRTSVATCWAEAAALLEARAFHAVLSDVRLPDANLIEHLPRMTQEQPVIVLTAFGSVQDAVTVMKAGATEYLVKPVNLDELELVLSRTIENAAVRKEHQLIKKHLAAVQGDAAMIGESEAMRGVRRLIAAVAPTVATVLVQGESGVGKELVAKAIHNESPRSQRNFFAVDCCTLQETLFESELFGHERGAFTGADRQKRGLIEGAFGGTLFLDEIGEISPAVQAKLLRVIETGNFRRLGGVRDLHAEVRIVAATNRDLDRMSQTGAFRRDLFFRLNAFVIEVPPLRQRREDIPLLVRHFVGRHPSHNRGVKRVADEAMERLARYDYPGNIRELRNIIERALIVAGDDGEIRLEHLGIGGSPPGSVGFTLAFDREPTLDEVEAECLHLLLAKHAGHRAKVAEVLAISERSVYRMIEKYGLK